jgi:endonuclease/exonuclease/phosphatase family metal-dependent hydrolase
MLAYEHPYPASMRVATFNVHHCEGRDGRVDTDRIARVVTEIGADVIALQELDLGLERTGFVNQPEELAAATGMTVEFHSLLQSGEGRYGIALAATEPFRSEKILLPRLATEEPRAALVARWRETTFIGTHLSRSRRARRAQIGALAALTKRVDRPVVVMGDLNEPPAGLGPLLDAGLTGPPRTLLGPGRRIDHILAGPGLRITGFEVLRTRASDHPALVADLEPSD